MRTECGDEQHDGYHQDPAFLSPQKPASPDYNRVGYHILCRRYIIEIWASRRKRDCGTFTTPRIINVCSNRL